MNICPQNGPYGGGPSYTPETEPEVKAPVKAKKLDYSVITQRVDCVFGHDHYITVKVNEDKSLGNITSTCSADKEETEGLILLGTPPMKTCLGYIDVFLKHATEGKGLYDLPQEYRGTFLSLAAAPIQDAVNSKKRRRETERAEAAEREKAQASEGLVQRRLREFIAKTLGTKRANLFSIRKEEGGRYTFNVQSNPTFDYRKQAHVAGTSIPIADRVDGVWVVRHDWDANEEVFRHTGSWGGDCTFCGGRGNRGHDRKKGHVRQVTKAMFLAMQASSQAGIRIVRDGVLNKDGEPVEFKYRANSKNLVGVTFAPAPFAYLTEEEDAPTDTSNIW